MVKIISILSGEPSTNTQVIATITKIMETIPEAEQQLVIEYMKEHINSIVDEERWDESFKTSQKNF